MQDTGQVLTASFICASKSAKLTPLFTVAVSATSNTSAATAAHTPQAVHPSVIVTFEIAKTGHPFH